MDYKKFDMYNRFLSGFEILGSERGVQTKTRIMYNRHKKTNRQCDEGHANIKSGFQKIFEKSHL